MEIPPLNDDAVQWLDSRDGAEGPTLLLLHGYGADEHDLLPLVPHLAVPARVAAVRAPLDMPWPSPGAAWYPIEGLDARDPSATTAATERLWEWVDRVLDEDEKVGFIGFSQGGAISLQALRQRPQRVEFVVNLSGYATPGKLSEDDTLALHKPPVFWGRGSADQVIPEALIVHTTDWLPAHSDLTGRIYPGLGHGISTEELADVAAFIQSQVARITG